MQISQYRILRTAQFIESVQLPSGAIPWFEGGIVDPWDHVEALMGLTVGGRFAAAKQGFAWLAGTQREDGAWFAAYEDQTVGDATRAETNFVAYPATGLWHYYLATQDLDTLQTYWPMISRAMNWVLNLQTDLGDIHWAVDSVKGTSKDALLTGCSSIYKSLECTIKISQVLGKQESKWIAARNKLGRVIRNHPERFDRTWPSKSRYSMDWFYPVLSGAVSNQAATDRLNARWSEFVEQGLGCRCVVEEPWVTIAETCELTMALVAANDQARAKQIFADLSQFQIEDGSWWTGYVFPDKTFWPDERPTWTAGAILLAADTLFDLTPAGVLFKTHLPEQQ